MSPARFLAPTLFVVLSLGGCNESPSSVSRGAPATSAGTPILVYKSPTCGCCKAWANHLTNNGFAVDVVDEPQMNPLKSSLGVPVDMRSCHTATVGDYVIEGHVPAQDIHRLLIELPQVTGLAVPGMPIGSPGMEMGDRVDPYTVFAFSAAERLAFARYGIASDSRSERASMDERENPGGDHK